MAILGNDFALVLVLDRVYDLGIDEVALGCETFDGETDEVTRLPTKSSQIQSPFKSLLLLIDNVIPICFVDVRVVILVVFSVRHQIHRKLINL